MNKSILVSQLRIFAMLQRVEKMKANKRTILIFGGCLGVKQFAEAMRLLGESTSRSAIVMKQLTTELSNLRIPKELDDKKINRASRRGHKESKRKKNFNHYSY